MWWALPLATSILGAQSAQRKQDAQDRMNKAAAEQTRYSAWTDMGPGRIQTGAPGALEGAISGGVQGLGIAQGFGMGGGSAPAPGGMPAQGGSMLGGDQMAQQMGQGMNSWDFQQQPNIYASNRPY